MMTIGIVGLGLIGGSLARAIKSRTPHTVLGEDADRDVVRRAIDDGAIDGALDEASLPGCELLLLALYPDAAVAYVERHCSRIAEGALVVDCCGVKRDVCAALFPLAARHGFVFVGGHPMAGKERSGYAASDPDLFDGASMILTPDAHASSESGVVDALDAFFRSVGFGRIVLTTPAEHDHMIAYTSQLAHVVSSAYVKSDSAQRHKGYSAGSFQDMTRVAQLNEAMWTQLCLANSDNLIEELDALIERLGIYADALRESDHGRFKELLREGRIYKENTL